jgi:MSHA biogenesis protein MshP
MSLVMAIFLLVVLAALGAFIVSLAVTQQVDLAHDLEGSRAYHAARAGLDYGAYQAIAPAVPNCAAQTVLALPAANFGEFASVTVLCTSTPHDEGGGQPKILYALTARACNQPTAAGVCPNPAPNGNYVERELQLTVINPP